jgi:HAMP domain-containing protein
VSFLATWNWTGTGAVVSLGSHAMRLVVKFNLVLAAVFGVGLGTAAIASRALLQRGASEEVLQDARLLMESALAARNYTSTQIEPLVHAQLDKEFLPQSVPAYSATEQFATVHGKFPEFTYKEATLNPTNLRDRASDWELDIVNGFRQYSDKAETIGERDTPNGRSLYLARPLVIRDPACLSCHSTVDAAPKSLIRRYGPANGFGWKLNEVIGAQIVSVPMTLPIERANRIFVGFIVSLAGIFAAVFVALNVMLTRIVVRPVTKLASLADEVSLGKIDGADFSVDGAGDDELSVLSQSFNRMKKSLTHAIKMLEE